jgi:hypothetical protein
LIMITHDLGVVAGLCDQVHVMYRDASSSRRHAAAVRGAGAPLHRWSAGARSPRLDSDRSAPLTPIPGSPPTSCRGRRAARSPPLPQRDRHLHVAAPGPRTARGPAAALLQPTDPRPAGGRSMSAVRTEAGRVAARPPCSTCVTSRCTSRSRPGWSSTERWGTSWPSTASTWPWSAARRSGWSASPGAERAPLGKAILRLVEPTSGPGVLRRHRRGVAGT